MACLVSLSFSMVLSPSPHPLYKEMHFRKSVLSRLSSKATITTAPQLFAACNYNRGLFSVNRSSLHHSITLSRPICQNVYPVSVGSCTHITGYWVGPDIDDGWGFVEAFINQIS